MKQQAHRSQLWIEKAEEDLRWAQLSLKHGFYSQVCYVTQQVAEKALKAYLIFHSISPEKLRTHILPALLKMSKETNPKFKRLDLSVRVLSRYYIPTRYPPDSGPLGEFSEKEAREAVKLAEEILKFVKKEIVI